MYKFSMKKKYFKIFPVLVVTLFFLSGCSGGNSGGENDTGTPAGFLDNSVFYGAYEETVGIGTCGSKTRLLFIGNNQSREGEENYIYLPQDSNEVSYPLNDENISISVSDHTVLIKKDGNRGIMELVFDFSSDYSTVKISGIATNAYAGECGETISGNATKVGSFAEDGSFVIRELSFSQETFAVSVQEGKTSSFQGLRIDTNNTTTTGYHISVDASWLSVISETGNTPEDVTLSVNGNGLSPGVYKATITGISSGYVTDQVDISLTVTETPELVFTKNKIEFTCQQGGTTQPQTLDLNTNNTTNAFYTIRSEASWLTITPASGSTPSNLQVAVDIKGLDPGVYTATITASASGYENDTVEVTLTVTAIPALIMNPETLSFTINQGDSTGSQTVGLDTSNSTTPGYNITDDASWLTVLPVTGSTPGSVTVSVDATGLAEGVYSATITAAAPGYTEDTVAVSLTVTGYQLQVSTSPSRSNPLPLNGRTVSGDIYAFSTPDTDASQVRFYLDDPAMAGVPFSVDESPPFDFVEAQQGYYMESGSLISIEAENYWSKVSQGGHDWTLVFPVGYSGSGAMQSTPNNGTNQNIDYLITSPRMDYQVDFSQTGTYYVWVRGTGLSEADDSVHIGLNGAAVSSSDRMYGFLPSWTWSQSTMDGPVATVTIPSIGKHTVNVWMREDGFIIDKVILLKTSSCPTCVGTAPVETVATAPFDTMQLIDGSHQIKASIAMDSGNTIVVSSNFTVANNTVSIPIVDDFSDGNANGWTLVSDSGKSATWQVISNQYRQTAAFGGSTYDKAHHTGLYTYLPEGLGLANYRFNADLTPLGQKGNDIGVMFRYSDNNNYYRLSFNARYGFTRLEKKVGGVFYPIATNARGYTKGQTIHVEIVLIGSLIHITVDGDSLFGVYDTSLSTGSVALYTQEEASFDNISIDTPLSDPKIVLATPLAHSVTTSSNLILSAIAYNMPANRAVKFFLNGTECESVTESPRGVFSSECFSIPRGNYSLEAVLYDNGTSVASDTNVKVAAQGDYVVAVGDSITNGSDDNFSLDNRSINGEIISIQGYEANLTDLITTNLNIPAIVYNEGIPGDDTYNANIYRIATILDRQDGVNKVLILLGTNDAGKMLPVQSGLGCSGSSCNGTYKGNMQSLINKVIAAGAVPIVGLVPPSFDVADPLNSAQNQLIQEYNTVITTELTGIQIGPDFFSFFLNGDDNFSNLFVDDVHPNGLGFVVMAHLWYNSLPVADIDMPYILYGLLPLNYKQNILEAGNAYYTDVPDYTVTSIPVILEDGIWINTANSDRNNTDDNYISFTTDRNIRLYIAYDGGAATRPNWMSGYTDTGVNLSTTNPSAPLHRLYRKDFPAGSVTLGGNLAAGANGADANYVVIVKEN